MIFTPDNRKHVISVSFRPIAMNVGGAGRIIMPDAFSYHTGSFHVIAVIIRLFKLLLILANRNQVKCSMASFLIVLSLFAVLSF